MSNRAKNNLRSLLIVMLTFILFCLPAATGLAAVNLTTQGNQQSSGEPAIKVTNQIESYLNDFITKDTARRNWKLLDKKVSVVSAEQSGYEVSMVFDVDRKHLLGFAKAEDSPALKGRLAFVQKNGKQLSANALAKANKEIEMWKRDLTEYITTPQNCFDRIKVTAMVNTADIVQPETVKFYREDCNGNFIPTSLQEIPSNDIVEKDAFNTIKANVSDNSQVGALAIVNYNRIAARDYVRTWATNTTKNCSTTSTTKQDKSTYNPNYSAYTCTDCANYVSQGLRAGGIPTDSTWYKDSTAWINVSSLTSYMTGKTYWIATTNINDCVAGFPFRMKAYSHVMMMSYNDGTTRKYCAHTSDRNDAIMSETTSTAYFYRVNY